MCLFSAGRWEPDDLEDELADTIVPQMNNEMEDPKDGRCSNGGDDLAVTVDGGDRKSVV